MEVMAWQFTGASNGGGYVIAVFRKQRGSGSIQSDTTEVFISQTFTTDFHRVRFIIFVARYCHIYKNDKKNVHFHFTLEGING